MLTIIRYPDRSLRLPAKPVAVEDRGSIPVESLMLAAKELNAFGIAANQIGDPRAYCLVAIPERAPFLMVNPRIVSEGEHTGFEDEWCLSLPGITVAVVRKLRVEVEWESESGNRSKEEFGGLAARIVQHELEHLRGTMILDHLSPLKRQKLKGYIAKSLRIEKWNLNYALKAAR